MHSISRVFARAVKAGRIRRKRSFAAALGLAMLVLPVSTALAIADDSRRSRPVKQKRAKGFAGAEPAEADSHLLSHTARSGNQGRTSARRLAVGSVLLVVADDLWDVGAAFRSSVKSGVHSRRT
jgi:hypothetical protein